MDKVTDVQAARVTSYAAEPSDEQRAEFARGNPAVMEELAERFFTDVYCFAYAITVDPDLALDAVQETFLRILESHRLYVPTRPFRPWLFTITRNTSTNLLRHRNADSLRIVNLEPTLEEIHNLASSVPTAFEEALRSERQAGLWHALGELPQTSREVIVLHIFDNLAFREIAAIIGSSLNTVASNYYRGLQKLRTLLDSETSSDLLQRTERRYIPHE